MWTCSPAGLANVEQHVTGPGGGPPPPGTVEFHHFRSQGVTVPTDLHVGSAWRQVVTSQARFTASGVQYVETQVVTTSFRVLGEESVTTQAGTFQALKIQTTSAIHKAAPDFGPGIDERSISSNTQWWARGVGIVKLMGDSSTTTIDLLAYHLP